MPWSPTSGISGWKRARLSSAAPACNAISRKPRRLVEAQRVDVVIRGDLPQPAAAGSSGYTLDLGEQHAADAAPPAIGV
jgi:hypothetical protein